jgi:hypothetical protein
MSVNLEYAKRRDLLFGRARKLIHSDSDAFERDCQELENRFTEQFTHQALPSCEDSKGRKCWISQLSVAVLEAKNEGLNSRGHSGIGLFDFLGTGSYGGRKSAARRFIVIILLGADPEANSVIKPEWFEPAGLAWEEPESGESILGREWVTWISSDWDDGNDPSPTVLSALEFAIEMLESAPDCSMTERRSNRSEQERHTKSEDESKIWITVIEAAKQAVVSSKTIKRWIDNDLLLGNENGMIDEVDLETKLSDGRLPIRRSQLRHKQK